MDTKINRRGLVWYIYSIVSIPGLCTLTYFIFTLTIIETSCKHVSSILSKSFFFIDKQRNLAPSRIEKEQFIAKNLKNSDRNPQNNSDFMMPKCMSHI